MSGPSTQGKVTDTAGEVRYACYESNLFGTWQWLRSYIFSLPSATKLRRLCFYTCLSVILFTGAVCLSACWDTTPRDQAHTLPGPSTSTPQDQAHTPETRHPRPGRHPPGTRHTPWDGTHPTGMHSCYI